MSVFEAVYLTILIAFIALSCVIACFIIRVVNELSRNLSRFEEKYKVDLTNDPFEYSKRSEK